MNDLAFLTLMAQSDLTTIAGIIVLIVLILISLIVEACVKWWRGRKNRAR